MKKSFINISILVFFLIPLEIIFCQDSSRVVFKTLPGSKVWIEGSSTINDFACITQKVEGYGSIINRDIFNSGGFTKKNALNDEAYLSLKVLNLDCGKERMNEDMFDAMKAEEFPFIKFDLVDVGIITESDTSMNSFNVKIKGNLSLAGKSNLISMVMTITKLKADKFRVQGNRQLFMKDFNIVPPSAFFGLIKAHDELVVYFDLIVGKIDEE
ncbi:MAG: YceI family protein [Ignavibacteriaceae bacterium]